MTKVSWERKYASICNKIKKYESSKLALTSKEIDDLYDSIELHLKSCQHWSTKTKKECVHWTEWIGSTYAVDVRHTSYYNITFCLSCYKELNKDYIEGYTI